MQCSAQFIDDVVVVSLRGKLTIGSGDEALRSTVLHHLNEGARRVVLDLGGVTTIDSSGTGELVSAYTTVTSRGGRLVLSRMPQKVRDYLTITQLITVFDVYDDIESAVAAVKSNPLPVLG